MRELAAACVRLVTTSLKITPDFERETLPIVDHYLDPVRRIADLDIPVIAKLQGDTVGGGFGLAIAAGVVPVWALVFGASAMVAPLLGIAVWAVSVGLVGYACLHLLFVVHGVLLGGKKLIRAIWESVVFIHAQLPAVAGLVVVIVVVYQGLGRVWSLPASSSWLTLVGIVGNACIATGLTAATFVFYEQRMPYALELVRPRRRANRA